MEALEAKEVALSDEVTGAGDERGAPGLRHALCSPRSCLGRHPPFQPVPVPRHRGESGPRLQHAADEPQTGGPPRLRQRGQVVFSLSAERSTMF